MAKQAAKLYAQTRVKHNGVVFEPGEAFVPKEISDEQREALITSGAVGAAPPSSPDSDGAEGSTGEEGAAAESTSSSSSGSGSGSTGS